MKSFYTAQNRTNVPHPNYLSDFNPAPETAPNREGLLQDQAARRADHSGLCPGAAVPLTAEERDVVGPPVLGHAGVHQAQPSRGSQP